MGDRLLYEPLHPGHAEVLFEALGDARVYEYISEVPPANAAQLAPQFAVMTTGPPPDKTGERWLNYTVRLRANGTFIGTLQATIIQQRAEVAYLFGPQFWHVATPLKP
jgi:RimJ/RimL family protein N-acetyltransferase